MICYKVYTTRSERSKLILFGIANFLLFFSEVTSHPLSIWSFRPTTWDREDCQTCRQKKEVRNSLYLTRCMKRKCPPADWCMHCKTYIRLRRWHLTWSLTLSLRKPKHRRKHEAQRECLEVQYILYDRGVVKLTSIRTKGTAENHR